MSIYWFLTLICLTLLARSEPLILEALPDLDHDGFADAVYDYIVVGGGGVGCLVARTFADSGFKTLLIERGGMPNDYHKNRPGITRALLGPGVQSVVTSTGVRSHLGATLGGGTAINYGVWISENADFYERVKEESQLGWKLDPLLSLLNASDVWTRDHLRLDIDRDPAVVSDDPVLAAYTNGFYKLLRQHVGRFAGNRDTIMFDSFWLPDNLLHESTAQRTSSADVALAASPNLTILLNSVAMTVDWQDGNDANCIVYRSTADIDLMPIGGMMEHSNDRYGLDGLFWNRNLRRRLQPSLFEDPLVDARPTIFPYRVCLNQNPSSRIVLSAGAVQTPLLAMRSGFGPPAEIEKMPAVKLVAPNAWVGQRLQDRPMLPLSFFLDGWQPSHQDIGRLRTAAVKIAERPDGQFSLFPIEEITGSVVLQSSLIAARVMFPVRMRSGMWAELGHYLMKRCVLDDNMEVMGRVFPILPAGGLKEDIVTHACRLFSPQARCFRNAVAWITFVSEVQSRGQIILDPMMPEHPIIQPNYLEHPEDRRDMRDNVKRLLFMLREAAEEMRELMLADHKDWCPARVFDSDASLLESITQMSLHQSKISDAQTFVPAAEALAGLAWRRRNSSIPLASFPQIWPDPDDDDSVEEFMDSYFTSMWHLVGSMSLGHVVDENLDVFDVRRLSIIDASVLPVMPRMNPSATLLTMGRAAAVLKVNLRRL